MARIEISIHEADFDVSAELARLREGDGGTGAVVAFVGTVRERSDGRDVQSMMLEHYPGMTERSIAGMAEAAVQRFGLRAVRVIHRVGALAPLEQIVLVAVASAHRGEAFQGCEFLMDYLKIAAPFWKKETAPDGTSRWVDARVADDAAAARWGLVLPDDTTPPG